MPSDNQDLFVLLSDFEGFPLSLVEAMARGCVPVAAEGKIYLFGESGETLVLRGGRTPQVLARNKLDLRVIASPAISGSEERRVSAGLDRLAERLGGALIPRLGDGEGQVRAFLASAGMYGTTPGRFLGYRSLCAAGALGASADRT